MNILLIGLLIGSFLGLLFWTSFQVYDEVPQEDRSYLDKPPLGFRVAWPFIKLFVYYFNGLISKNYQYITQARLKKAGVEYCVNASQFFASKICASLFFALLVFLVLYGLEKVDLVYLLIALLGGFYYPEIWLKEVTNSRDTKLFKALPFYLDIITLSVEAGTNLTSGINQAVQKAPESPLRTEFSRVLRDIRAGKPRAESLREMANRVSMSSVNNVVSSMVQAEKTGASLGPVLRAQSDQLRTNRFLKAEKMAMEAPVKLLGPLIMFIFPTTFMVIGFVLLSKALTEGIITWAPLVWAINHP